MSHEEVTDLLALESVGALEASDRDAMESHLATCAPCRHVAAEYADLASLLPAALDPVPPPARLRRNLMAQVYAEATASPSVRRDWMCSILATPPDAMILTSGTEEKSSRKALRFGPVNMPSVLMSV